MTRPRIKKEHYGYLFIAPFIIGFLLFGLYPVIHTLTLSLTDTTLMKAESNFIGLKNFQRLFDNQYLGIVAHEFHSSAWNFHAPCCVVHQFPLEDQRGRNLAYVVLHAKFDDVRGSCRVIFQSFFVLRSS